MKLLFAIFLCVGLVSAAEFSGFEENFDWPTYDLQSNSDSISDNSENDWTLAAATGGSSASGENVNQVVMEVVLSGITLDAVLDEEDLFLESCADTLGLDASDFSLNYDGMYSSSTGEYGGEYGGEYEGSEDGEYGGSEYGGSDDGEYGGETKRGWRRLLALRNLLDEEDSAEFEVTIDGVSDEDAATVTSDFETALEDNTIVELVAESASSFEGVTTEVVSAEYYPTVDCVGSWGGWSSCPVSCSSAVATRTYTVSTPAEYGGEECDYSDGDTQTTACVCQNGTEEDDELSDGEVAAVVLSVILFVVIVGLIIYWCMKNRIVLADADKGAAVPTKEPDATAV